MERGVETHSAKYFNGAGPASAKAKANGSGNGHAALTRNHEVALALAKAGFHVFPCRADKRPMPLPWREQSTCDRIVLNAWWAQWPDALPAIDLAKAGLVVIDSDRHEDGPDGVTAWAAICAENDWTGDAAQSIVDTSGGGEHFFFRQPEKGKPLGNAEGNITGLGINVRGHGGYVIAPGATLPDGRRWRGRKGAPCIVETFANDRDAIPIIPDWIVRRLTARRVKERSETKTLPKGVAGPRERAYAATALDQNAAELAEAKEGGRNNKLNAIAYRMGRMIGAGWIDRAAVERALEGACIINGLGKTYDDYACGGAGEVDRTMRSGIEAGIAEPHDALPADESAIKYYEDPSGAPGDGATKSALAKIKTFSFRGLQHEEFPLIKYVVPGYIVEGLTLVAGNPKMGKSWLALDMALAVADGGSCLGVACEEGDVLLLALEDNKRRLQDRGRKLSPGAGDWPERLTFATQWPQSEEGGLAAIREWLEQAPNPRLVVIDVLGRFRSGRKQTDTLYDGDYQALSALQKLALEFNVAIVVLHHTRKSAAVDDPFEKVSGTQGLAGAADTIVMLTRDNQGATLYGRGRDIPDFDMAVAFDDKATFRWRVLGQATEVRRTGERNAILSALVAAGETGMTPTEIAAEINKTRSACTKLLIKMVKAGEALKTGYGRYLHPSRVDNIATETETETGTGAAR